MKLYLYFARRFTTNLLAVTAIFLLLAVILEMIEILRVFGSHKIGFVEVFRMTALRVPHNIYDIFPLIVILSSISMFLSLAKTSELVVTRAAGRSALRSLVSPITVVLFVGFAVIGLLNPIVAATSKQYEILENRYKKGTTSILSVSRDGLWLRQKSQSGQTVIRAQRSNLDGTKLFSVTFIGFNPDGQPSYRIEADSAQLQPGAWLAKGVKEWRFVAGENAEMGAVQMARVEIPSDLTADQIRDGFGSPLSVPIWELPAFIERLERAGFSARRHQVWLQTELAKPILLVTMVMIGAAFTMRHTRFGHTGIMVLFAIMLGFGIYFIRNFAQILGENGQIPIMLAAWAPPIAGIMLSLGLLLHLEEG